MPRLENIGDYILRFVAGGAIVSGFRHAGRHPSPYDLRGFVRRCAFSRVHHPLELPLRSTARTGLQPDLCNCGAFRRGRTQHRIADYLDRSRAGDRGTLPVGAELTALRLVVRWSNRPVLRWFLPIRIISPCLWHHGRMWGSTRTKDCSQSTRTSVRFLIASTINGRSPVKSGMRPPVCNERASVSRSVKGFSKLVLGAGESKTVKFILNMRGDAKLRLSSRDACRGVQSTHEKSESARLRVPSIACYIVEREGAF
jgi:hypothetical protein